MPKFYLKTFGCAQNTADSERIKAFYQHKGWQEVVDWKKADEIIINSCIVRESAENRVYGLINNIRKNSVARKPKIILTGCLAAVAKQIKGVDEILPINQITTAAEPLRCRQKTALISITSGCNHFCSYCIVPYTRGREVSRPSKEILKEIDQAIKDGFKEILLIGQNVNSWNNNKFPQLLETIANRPLNKISFVSSNPWKFSDELIKVIARHNNIDRLIHLPLQSGDDKILKKMNRGYTAADYLNLIEKIKSKVKNSKFSTDIIVGFPGEDEKAFQNTVKLCRRVGFEIAYINKYSPRPGTISAKIYPDNVPQTEKKRRWKILNELINK